MNITILARSPPTGFFLCPKSSNKQGEELMNDIFKNIETMQESVISKSASPMPTKSPHLHRILKGYSR